MKINPQMFRGYDLRGIAGVDLNSEIVEHIGRAYGTYIQQHGIAQTVVGRDSRATSPEYSRALIAGMNWAGILFEKKGRSVCDSIAQSRAIQWF